MAKYEKTQNSLMSHSPSKYQLYILLLTRFINIRIILWSAYSIQTFAFKWIHCVWNSQVLIRSVDRDYVAWWLPLQCPAPAQQLHWCSFDTMARRYLQPQQPGKAVHIHTVGDWREAYNNSKLYVYICIFCNLPSIQTLHTWW